MGHLTRLGQLGELCRLLGMSGEQALEIRHELNDGRNGVVEVPSAAREHVFIGEGARPTAW